MLVPTLTNHVDSLPLIAHWLKDSSTHPNLFLVPALSFLAYLQFPPPCVSGAVLFPIYIETSQRPIFRSLYLFRWPLPLWNSDADADLESHPVDQLFTQPSFPVLQMQPVHKASPEFSLFRAVHPIQPNIEGVRFYKNGKGWKISISVSFGNLHQACHQSSKRGLQATQKATSSVLWLENKPILSKKFFHLEILALY